MTDASSDPYRQAIGQVVKKAMQRRLIPAASPAPPGNVKGQCDVCNRNVLETEYRIKNSVGMYRHKECYDAVVARKLHDIRASAFKEKNLQDILKKNQIVGGVIKGVCGECHQNVTDDHERVKVGDTYYHVICPK